jgi:hypothetical protein
MGYIGPDVSEACADLIGGSQEPGGHVSLPQVGGMDEDTQQETHRINEEMAFAAIMFLREVIRRQTQPARSTY